MCYPLLIFFVRHSNILQQFSNTEPIVTLFQCSFIFATFRYRLCNGSENVHLKLLSGRPWIFAPIYRYVYILRPFKPIITRPRNAVIHEKAKFRRLMHRINNQNCSYSLRRYRTAVVRAHYLPLNLHSSWHWNSEEKLDFLLPGNRSSKWYYPAVRVGYGF